MNLYDQTKTLAVVWSPAINQRLLRRKQPQPALLQSLLKAAECSKNRTNCALEGQGPLRSICRDRT